MKAMALKAAPEPIKGFQPNLTQIFPIAGYRTDRVSKVMRSKVKATDYIFQMHFGTDSDVLLVVLQRGKKSKVKRKMHPQRLPVEFYLAIVVAVVKFVLVPFAR